MPTGPNGEKRPRDPVACAVKVARILTGETAEDYDPDWIKKHGQPKPRRRVIIDLEKGIATSVQVKPDEC